MRLLHQPWNGAGEEDSKRRKMDIKLESEDANFPFSEVGHGASPDNKSTTTRTAVNGIGLGGISGGRTGNGTGNSVGRIVGVTRPRPAMGVLAKRAPATHQGPITLTSQLCKWIFLFLRRRGVADAIVRNITSRILLLSSGA